MSGHRKIGKYLLCFLLAIVGVLAVYTIYAAVSFQKSGLDEWLVGQSETDHYPNWTADTTVLKAERDVARRDRLFVSRAYLICGPDSCQLRFRIAYDIPFLHDGLFFDTSWLELSDGEGGDYLKFIMAWPSKIGGLNCVDVALVMDKELYSALSGKYLMVSAVCKDKDKTGNAGDAYAGFEAEILIPEID